MLIDNFLYKASFSKNFTLRTNPILDFHYIKNIYVVLTGTSKLFTIPPVKQNHMTKSISSMLVSTELFSSRKKKKVMYPHGREVIL